ncbi:hypothetical protein OHU34_44750 (plasmid) [Streptomyces sp. NBC_00080]|uniref:hypothetical protein n=1 Tax=unclassified Streptomyces TaxID=2593676 RepID=UPI001168A581|nr:hypothetical protein [Streptomyces sp. SLBN-115]TQJ37749.1 hypothetical protein FBY34_7898 [Streptomyces sp. SLBN-115]
MSATQAGPETPQRWRHLVRPAPHPPQAITFNGLVVPAATGRFHPAWAMAAVALSVTTVFANFIGARPTPCCSPPSAATPSPGVTAVSTTAPLQAERDAGAADAEIGEVVGHLALNVLTNHFNLAKVDNDWPVVTPRSVV